MNDEDLTARIAELAAIIEAGLAADEATAKAAGRWGAEEGGACWISDQGYVVDRGRVVGVITGTATPEAVFAHIARNDPDRRRRDVKATRELVAEILAEGHHYDESDYYCCSQAREALYDGWTQTGEGPPGSACSDPERSGKPCDCGRDARAARRLGIIAAEWEG